MFSGFYTAASGMLMNQRSLNMAANNIANVKTSGYKPKRLVKTTFDQQLVREMNGRTEGLGQGSTISVGTREMTTHGRGLLRIPERPMIWLSMETGSLSYREKTASI